MSKAFGSKPDYKSIKKAKRLRKRGLSYRNIVKVMGRQDIKTIFRWINNYDENLKRIKVDNSLDKV
ncbi:MAG: hypothetical protein ACOZBH_04615 [Patescibacteria group bacterium]